ncbi:uncharacterized protein [Aegilops tauschii subsp. strangulata]|uniref:uncharacterized protein n=1 Tax=Aegilops tauschii subsp. strangulata TaxID=200361 RepID=UPI003CC8AE1D
MQRAVGARSCVPHIGAATCRRGASRPLWPRQHHRPVAAPPEDTVMAISRSAVSGGVSAKAFQLRAWVQGREVLMLVDSGSTNSFIDRSLAETIQGAQPLLRAYRVRVADGRELICSAVIPNCLWCSQGHNFNTNLKVLTLGAYGAILGMDWLEAHSPMTVDCRAKHLQFFQHGTSVSLHGHEAESTTCLLVNALQLQSLCRNNAVTHVVCLFAISDDTQTAAPTPPCLQEVLVEFADVFGQPEGLPPRCSCDHHIPLVSGAQPFSSRPYRHKTEHKDEIERQVAELLKSVVIQLSTSPFSSPAILVKKKGGTRRLCVDYRQLNALTCIAKYPVPVIEELLDELLKSVVIQLSTSPFSSPAILVKKKGGTRRLCVDYRQLNALTCIAKYPVPVIEELLDELHGACWFSKLDLRTGYHQIRLAEGEDYKTAFQTHSGHYEFKVLSFGLVGGPATFNGAIQTTLQPVNRKCTLSFFGDILVFSKTLPEHREHLRQVLELLRKDHWKVKLSKCEFGQQQLSYLGHVIIAQGVSTEPSKIAAVAS